jgi:hypothetical protein
MMKNTKISLAIFAIFYAIFYLHGGNVDLKKNEKKTLKLKQAVRKKRISDERLSKPPQNLIDNKGNPELDLVDPFQRSFLAGDSGELPGFTSTSLGDMPSGIKVLAIVIPENKEKSAIALVKLPYSGQPYLVKEGDLVRINKNPDTKRKSSRNRSGRNKKKESDFSLMALKTLQTFDFYLFIKKIHPTYIEAYQKKRPNQIINLRP